MAPWAGGPARPVTTDVPLAFSFQAAFSPGGRWFGAALLIDDFWTLLGPPMVGGRSGRPRLVPAGEGFIVDLAIDDDGTIAFATTGADGGIWTRLSASSTRTAA